MKTRYLAILATLAFLGFSVPAAAHPCKHHDDKSDEHCIPDTEPAPSGGGKAFLFEIDEEEFPGPECLGAECLIICGGAINPTGDSSGQFSVSGNVLWDPNNIHVHFKLQLKDVDPGTYPIHGNNDIECPGTEATNPFDFPACEGGICTVGHVSITVKQNGQGRTSGVLQLPGCDAGKTTTVWVTVPLNVPIVPGQLPQILRSTPVTIVLPPNEVGTGDSCP